MIWLLITILHTGGIGAVVEVDGPAECVTRSHFEMRYDPQVKSTFCALARKSTEA